MNHISINNRKMLIIAGEASGDLHAASLVRQIKLLMPDIEVTALAGRRTYEACDKFIYDLASIGLSGFIEPIVKLPFLFKLFNKIENYLDTQHPDFVVLVDYYGFNSHVLKMAHARKIPVYYYVTPQVWASRQWRAKTLAKYCTKMFTIYPFEPAFHAKYGGRAEFLGNPLLDIVPPPYQGHDEVSVVYWKIGILPGSRNSEISRLVPVFYKTFQIIKETHASAKAFLFAVPEFDDEYYKKLLGPEGAQEVTIVRENDYFKRSQMDFLLTCSGTATLENALLGVPMLVAYKLSAITYRIARMVVKVSYISLVNILANKEVVKEFIQEHATPAAMAWEARKYLDEPEELANMKKELLALRASLGKPGLAERAAKDILAEVYRDKQNG